MSLPASPELISFFELLRQLERRSGRFGRSDGPSKEPARLGQGLRQSFATGDIQAVVDRGNDKPPQVLANAIGLYGPEGPMPFHITRWMLERASNRWFSGDDLTTDTAFLDFSNLLQHRMIAFYWRSWADHRPAVQVEKGTGGAVMAMMQAFAGIGLSDETDRAPDRAYAKLHHATSLFKRVQGPDRLTEYLGSVIGQPVALTEFVGVWTEIPPHLQTRLGRTAGKLGQDAVIGARFFERQGRAEIKIGPLDLPNFTALLDDKARREELRHAILFAMGRAIEFDVVLSLDAADVPPTKLGEVRLGEVSWLGRPDGETADDKVLRRFTTKPTTPRKKAA
ncbi:MAG: type VI secretion system baseplate subunit TssG [Pseudomonadota bacterium]